MSQLVLLWVGVREMVAKATVVVGAAVKATAGTRAARDTMQSGKLQISRPDSWCSTTDPPATSWDCGKNCGD